MQAISLHLGVPPVCNVCEKEDATVKVRLIERGMNTLKFYLLSPEAITVSPEQKNHTDEEIAAFCDFLEGAGQFLPVTVRFVNNEIVLVAGYNSYAAAMLYNQRHQDKPMKLKCFSKVD